MGATTGFKLASRVPIALTAACLASGVASAQTTNCQYVGLVWTCNQSSVAPQSAPPNNQWMLDLMTNKAGQEQQAAINAANARARDQAFGQVGDLIARGDCDGARRVAAFYNRDDLKAAIARACN